MKANCAILILAAGSSSRMGVPKQLLPWKNTTLLENIIQQATEANKENVFVVLGANIDEIKTKVAFKNTSIIYNNRWKLGMGTSISCGIEFIQKNFPNYTSVLITLSDQPYISSLYLKILMNEFNSTSKKIVATKVENRISVPAIFGACYFKELKKLNEDKGAKNILKKHHQNVKEITSKINFIDIDTMDIYKTEKNKCK